MGDWNLFDVWNLVIGDFVCSVTLCGFCDSVVSGWEVGHGPGGGPELRFPLRIATVVEIGWCPNMIDFAD